MLVLIECCNSICLLQIKQFTKVMEIGISGILPTVEKVSLFGGVSWEADSWSHSLAVARLMPWVAACLM